MPRGDLRIGQVVDEIMNIVPRSCVLRPSCFRLESFVNEVLRKDRQAEIASQISEGIRSLGTGIVALGKHLALQTRV